MLVLKETIPPPGSTPSPRDPSCQGLVYLGPSLASSPLGLLRPVQVLAPHSLAPQVDP